MKSLRDPFQTVFVEEAVKSLPRTQSILRQVQSQDVRIINKIEDIFGRTYKPYLSKRTHLNLFLGEKKGHLVKQTPPAYGMGNTPHYYFIYAYNCIYECHYCYLQGYFKSPDIVLFLNHEEICERIIDIARQPECQKEVWFHGGEYSDSLALSHLTGEIPLLWKTFSQIPHGFLELRTKSGVIAPLLKEEPLDNVIPSYSLAPHESILKHESKTPPLKIRLRAMKKLIHHGYKLGIHLDPIIYDNQDIDDFFQLYKDLIAELVECAPPEKIAYISTGVVRCTQSVYRAIEKNYPKSSLVNGSAGNLCGRADGKVSYSRPIRMYILRQIKELLVKAGYFESQVYFCMEEEMKDEAHTSCPA